MKMMINRKNFSLIELLIVIGILGALLTLVLPGFNNTGEDAKDKVARTEMREIQTAFRRFAADVMFREKDKSNEYLADIAKYGLWPLMWESHPDSSVTGITYKEYDSETALGRRGPYLREEGLIKIAAPIATLADASGQKSSESESGTVKIPVVKDPYGGYYRVLVPAARSDDGNNLSEFKRLQKMVLVCTGPDRELDTKVDSFLAKDHADYTAANADDIVAQGDDIVIRLMPLAGY